MEELTITPSEIESRSETVVKVVPPPGLIKERNAEGRETGAYLVARPGEKREKKWAPLRMLEKKEEEEKGN